MDGSLSDHVNALEIVAKVNDLLDYVKPYKLTFDEESRTFSITIVPLFKKAPKSEIVNNFVVTNTVENPTVPTQAIFHEPIISCKKQTSELESNGEPYSPIAPETPKSITELESNGEPYSPIAPETPKSTTELESNGEPYSPKAPETPKSKTNELSYSPIAPATPKSKPTPSLPPRTPDTPNKIRIGTEKAREVKNMVMCTGDTRGPGWTAHRRAEIVDTIKDLTKHIEALNTENEELRSIIEERNKFAPVTMAAPDTTTSPVTWIAPDTEFTLDAKTTPDILTAPVDTKIAPGVNTVSDL